MKSQSPAAGRPIDLLRSRTVSAHEALHVHPFLAPLGRTPAPGELRSILIGFFRFHRGCEAALAGHPLASIASPQCEWLEADLASLGLSAPILGGLSPLPIGHAGSDAEALGLLYVTEGSTLGGQQIARHLQTALGRGPEAGFRFFAGHGPKETGRRWKAFCARLDGLSPRGAETAAAMADHAFTLLADSFDDPTI